jgi:LuxR family transcriptional regulator, maltose regulon positive regulatory protein
MSFAPAELLLTTKLSVPRSRMTTVPRPHLLARLNLGDDAPLTLISAPAGFGKTTLLSDWAGRGADAVAWVSLDADDNEPARFWAYLLTAMGRAAPELREPVAELLRTLDPPAIKGALTALINRLAATPARTRVVIDDYHLIESAAIHDALAFLIDNLPAGLRLVIASRVDPPLPLARLRARGRLVEVRTPDLRFAMGEASELIRSRHPALASDDVAALNIRTEGWVAGLQLALTALDGRADPASFITTFTGSHRAISDYLVEEVLRQQPEAVQSFLLRTSILKRLSGPLCDVLLDAGPGDRSPPAGQDVLEALDRANIFVVPLDDERRWYRYHHLFAEFLRELLQRRSPALLPALHRRAARWYERHGLLADAIGHAFQAEDPEWTADLLEQAAQPLLVAGETSRLLGWLALLPEEVLAARPRLCLDRAWALLQGGDFEQADGWFRVIERRFGERPLLPASAEAPAAPERASAERIRQAELLAVHALLTAARGDLAQAGEIAGRGLAVLPPETRGHVRASLHVMEGVTATLRGATSAARQALVEAREALEGREHQPFSSITISFLSQLHEVQGDLRLAYRVAQQAAQRHASSDHLQSQTLMSLATMGRLLYEWNDIAGAKQALARGQELLGRVTVPPVLVDYHTTRAFVHYAEGDAAAAFAALREADGYAGGIPEWPYVDNVVAPRRARLWLLLGDREAAARWADGYLSRRGNDAVSLWWEQIDLVRARVYLALGRIAEADALLDGVLPLAEREQRLGSIVEVLALRALALSGVGDQQAALEALERSLSLAEPEGYVRVFLDMGQPLAPLLALVAERGGARAEYAHRLAGLDGGGARQLPDPQADPEGTPRPPRSLVEPLSERELEVLRLLATERSNREIAEMLVIAPSTLKVHLKNIYGKLGVHNRAQAILRAQSLQLVTA